MVLSGHGPAFPFASTTRRRHPALSCRPLELLRVDLARVLPFNIARTWHLQLAIFWVATSFLAAGIFLTPMIVGGEPRRQNWLAYGLLGALALVVFGSMAGEYAGIKNWIQHGWEWFGASRLRVSRSGAILAGPADRGPLLLDCHFVPWIARTTEFGAHGKHAVAVLFFRALDPSFLCGRVACSSASHFTTTDFWRFWVVHLWVEDFLELFTTIMVAYIFVLLGVVNERVALTVIYLDIVLYSAGGVIGSMHHVYFSGEPAVHMALGAFFSAAEVIPLTFLTVEAWGFLQLGATAKGLRARRFPISGRSCSLPQSASGIS